MTGMNLWALVIQEVERLVPEATATLNGPCSPAAVVEADRLLGHPLPEDLKSVYAQVDGQPAHAVSGLFFGMVFLTVEDSLQFVKDVQQWHADAPDLAEEESHASQPLGTVLPFASHPHWWPFAGDGGGRYLALDFAPDAAGQMGQVIHFGSGTDPVHVLAPSFASFLKWYLAQLRAGNSVVVRADGVAAQRLEIAYPRRPNFPDAVAELYRLGELPSTL